MVNLRIILNVEERLNTETHAFFRGNDIDWLSSGPDLNAIDHMWMKNLGEHKLVFLNSQ